MIRFLFAAGFGLLALTFVGCGHVSPKVLLIRACQSDDVASAKEAIQAGASATAADAAGWTPLHRAASLKADRVAKLLISYGDNVNAVTHRGETPLMEAAAADDPDGVAILLKAGANKLAKSAVGGTALDVAEASGDAKLISLLK